MSNVKPIPEGFHSLTPYLIVDGAEAAIELYKRAFGAEVLSVHRMPDGKVLNAQLRIGDSVLMLNDEWPEYGALGPKKIGDTAVTIHIYTDDVDGLWQRALAAGMEPRMPLDQQPWGDRYGSVKDSFGHSWSMATRAEQVSDEELERRFASMGSM